VWLKASLNNLKLNELLKRKPECDVVALRIELSRRDWSSGKEETACPHYTSYLTGEVSISHGILKLRGGRSINRAQAENA
jgi:hypothetical protein